MLGRGASGIEECIVTRRDRSGDAKELQVVGLRIEQSDGFFGGALESTGVDDPGFADAVVAPKMAMAVEEIIVLLGFEEGIELGDVIAMEDGDFLAVEFEIGDQAMTWNVNGFGVALQAGAIPIVIAEYECALETGEMIEHVWRADVAAVDEKLSAARLQSLDRLPHDFIAVVRVAEDPEEH
jgi:hypothetical protein